MNKTPLYFVPRYIRYIKDKGSHYEYQETEKIDKINKIKYQIIQKITFVFTIFLNKINRKRIKKNVIANNTRSKTPLNLNYTRENPQNFNPINYPNNPQNTYRIQENDYHNQ
jgi:hypothetical protein